MMKMNPVVAIAPPIVLTLFGHPFLGLAWGAGAFVLWLQEK